MTNNISKVNNSETLMATIVCLVYNHEAYLRRCLDGFVMQKTDFRFEAIVHDDCSTDGSRAIIEEYAEKYPDIIKPIYEEDNQYSKHDGSLDKVLFDNSHGKYVAMCEGDDYWIDSLKLQKQVDFLNAHPDYTLIGSNGIILYTDIDKGLAYFNNHKGLRDVSFSELVNTWVFPTASLCYRKEILNHYPTWSKELHFGDDIIVMTCAIHGKVATLGELSCVYRKGSGITKDMDKEHEYMAEQHKLFYTHILEDTGEKYRDILLERIKKDEQERLFWHLRGKSELLAALKFPRKAFILWVPFFFRVVKSFMKRCLKMI